MLRRPTAESLLDSPYFSPTVKSAYLFTAPLHLLAKGGTRLTYAASFAKEGALRAMGTFVAEMCAPYCLPLVTTPLSDDESELAYVLLKELIKSLTPIAVQSRVLPSIQRILLVHINVWFSIEFFNLPSFGLRVSAFFFLKFNYYLLTEYHMPRPQVTRI